jgi:hypothetical protein
MSQHTPEKPVDFDERKFEIYSAVGNAALARAHMGIDQDLSPWTAEDAQESMERAMRNLGKSAASDEVAQTLIQAARELSALSRAGNDPKLAKALKEASRQRADEVKRQLGIS